jgi:hypothetical protein
VLSYLIDVCPCNWTRVGNKCYKFSLVSAKWDVARAACQNVGGDLVIISNSAENDLLVYEAKTRGLMSSWTGYFRYLSNSLMCNFCFKHQSDSLLFHCQSFKMYLFKGISPSKNP